MVLHRPTTWTLRNSGRLVGNTANSTSAPYTFFDGTASRGIVQVSQKVTPSDLSEAGVAWKTLASSFAVTSGTLKVQLSNQNGQVMADAIRIEKVADINANTPVLLITPTPVTPFASGTSIAFGTTFAGSPVAKTFTVTHLGSASMTLGGLTLPAGFSAGAGFGSSTLTPGQSTTLTLQLIAGAAGDYSGTCSLTSNDPNNPTFQISVAGSVTAQGYVDNTSATFSVPWAWQKRQQ